MQSAQALLPIRTNVVYVFCNVCGTSRKMNKDPKHDYSIHLLTDACCNLGLERGCARLRVEVKLAQRKFTLGGTKRFRASPPSANSFLIIVGGILAQDIGARDLLGVREEPLVTTAQTVY